MNKYKIKSPLKKISGRKEQQVTFTLRNSPGWKSMICRHESDENTHSKELNMSKKDVYKLCVKNSLRLNLVCPLSIFVCPNFVERAHFFLVLLACHYFRISHLFHYIFFFNKIIFDNCISKLHLKKVPWLGHSEY